MTAYRHFRDLNALIAAVLTDQFGRVIRESATTASDAPTQADYIASLATATTRAIMDHPLFTAVIDSEPNILLPLVHERFGATQQLAIGLLRDAIGRAVAHRDDQTVQVDNPDFAAISVVLMCQSFAFSRHAYDEVMKPADADAQLHHAVRSFIGTAR